MEGLAIKLEHISFSYNNSTVLKDLCLEISYGEHIEDGSVRRIIDNRDFSFINTF